MKRTRKVKPDISKEIKKVSREMFGITPTRVEKSKKKYNRRQNKKIDYEDE